MALTSIPKRSSPLFCCAWAKLTFASGSCEPKFGAPEAAQRSKKIKIARSIVKRVLEPASPLFHKGLAIFDFRGNANWCFDKEVRILPGEPNSNPLKSLGLEVEEAVKSFVFRFES